VVMGTAAIERPDLVTEVARHGPVAVGLDVRGANLVLQGWTRDSGLTVETALELFGDRAVDAFVVTRVERDGSLSGPDLDGLSRVLEATEVGVVASGGVGSLKDLRALARLGGNTRSLAGVIVGRALYEREFDIPGAMTALKGP
jgi:phosphoribosylformimino-5-aminoimidazole carboxamide ribonucleotide (ProFAR) isomerase